MSGTTSRSRQALEGVGVFPSSAAPHPQFLDGTCWNQLAGQRAVTIHTAFAGHQGPEADGLQ